jgi:hypothetical protein
MSSFSRSDLWLRACQNQFALPEKASGKVERYGVRFIFLVIARWLYGEGD